MTVQHDTDSQAISIIKALYMGAAQIFLLACSVSTILRVINSHLLSILVTCLNVAKWHTTHEASRDMRLSIQNNHRLLQTVNRTHHSAIFAHQRQEASLYPLQDCNR